MHERIRRERRGARMWRVGGLATGIALACGDGDRSDAGWTGPASGTPTTDADTSGAPAATGESAAEAEGSPDGTSDPDDGGTAVLYDVAAGETGEPGDGCECAEIEWSYLWVANSSESTISKINTRTLLEEGRYSTSPTFGNPSRTSVSIDARAVAVANRSTGIVKVWARPELCADANGNGVVDTSTGKLDVKPWAGGEPTDECIAWHTEFPDMHEQRPVQWTPGVVDPVTCENEEQKIWTVTSNGETDAGDCAWVHLLDGETGVVEATITLPYPQWSCETTYFGAYGGAVDDEGNFYFHQHAFFERLGRVDVETHELEIIGGAGQDVAGYGITVDSKGRVWFSGNMLRLDFATQQVDYVMPFDPSGFGGLAQDQQDRMWASYDVEDASGVFWVDLETMAMGDLVPLPDHPYVKGVSVDIDGFVWAVPMDGHAYKIDPDTYEIASYDGLTNPYTYSDMTGGQLHQVHCGNPQG